MLIIALVLALIGLVALVFAVVTSNELVAWVCIAASVVGVVLLILDALRERQRRDAGGEESQVEEHAEDDDEALEYPEEVPDEDHADAATEQATVPADGHGDEPAK